PQAVGPIAALQTAEQLALGKEHRRHQRERDDEDEDRLDDLHPPGLVVAHDGRQGHRPAPLLAPARPGPAPSPGAAARALAASGARKRSAGEHSTSTASHTERQPARSAASPPALASLPGLAGAFCGGG